MRRLAAHTLVAVLLLPALVASEGCEHHFFRPRGSITSQGGEYGNWQAIPEGCTRDTDASLPPGAHNAFTLVWRDMRYGGERIRDSRLPKPGNIPLRLEVFNSPTGDSGALQTMFTAGSTPLDGSDCSEFQATSKDAKPAIPGGRPTLDGTLKFECTVHGSRVRADLSFAGCEY